MQQRRQCMTTATASNMHMHMRRLPPRPMSKRPPMWRWTKRRRPTRWTKAPSPSAAPARRAVSALPCRRQRWYSPPSMRPPRRSVLHPPRASVSSPTGRIDPPDFTSSDGRGTRLRVVMPRHADAAPASMTRRRVRFMDRCRWPSAAGIRGEVLHVLDIQGSLADGVGRCQPAAHGVAGAGSAWRACAPSSSGATGRLGRPG